jgi:hypothetical protein
LRSLVDSGKTLPRHADEGKPKRQGEQAKEVMGERSLFLIQSIMETGGACSARTLKGVDLTNWHYFIIIISIVKNNFNGRQYFDEKRI